MSIHPSLKTGKAAHQNSVLKRLARLLRLQKEDKWVEGDSVFGLAKVKVIKMKLKKEKKVETPEEAAAAAAEAGAEGVAAPAAEGAEAKPGAKPGAKEEGKKPEEKK